MPLPQQQPQRIIKVRTIIKRSLNFNIVLFPGVIFHELAHLIASLLFGARVTKAKFWDPKRAEIVHEEVGGIRGYFISTAPFFFGTFLSIIFTYLAQEAAIMLKPYSPWQAYFQVILLYYLAISAAYHCFPSKKDTSNARRELVKHYPIALSFRRGFVTGIIAWLTLIPVFIPLYISSLVMSFFASIPNLGLLWYVIIFFGVAALTF
ncbi:MAG: hypothetical protein J7K68_00975 [Candidatus Diapherotrites archaeon]|nr:hypothetical protein [Candidatus Diapherotrites archaeon]